MSNFVSKYLCMIIFPLLRDDLQQRHDYPCLLRNTGRTCSFSPKWNCKFFKKQWVVHCVDATIWWHFHGIGDHLNSPEQSNINIAPKQAGPKILASTSKRIIKIAATAGTTPPKAWPIITAPAYKGGNLPEIPNIDPWWLWIWLVKHFFFTFFFQGDTISNEINWIMWRLRLIYSSFGSKVFANHIFLLKETVKPLYSTNLYLLQYFSLNNLYESAKRYHKKMQIANITYYSLLLLFTKCHLLM